MSLVLMNSLLAEFAPGIIMLGLMLMALAFVMQVGNNRPHS